MKRYMRDGRGRWFVEGRSRVGLGGYGGALCVGEGVNRVKERGIYERTRDV